MTSFAPDDPDLRIALGAAQCIELRGEDARSFAQAQFSGDVRRLEPLRWHWNAWLDPKGRARALMHLADTGDGRLLILLRGGDARTLCEALRRFVLRAPVTLNPLPGLHCGAGSALPTGELRKDGDGIGFGYGERSLWLQAAEGTAAPELETGFRLADIRAGWPALSAGAADMFLPPALGLEHLHAVSFDKGCYPGQEIAARLHYRGGHKRRLVHLSSDKPLAAGQMLGPDTRDRVLLASPSDSGFEALAALDESVDISMKYSSNLKLIRWFDA